MFWLQEQMRTRQCTDGWFSLAELPSHFWRSKFEVLNLSPASDSFMMDIFSSQQFSQNSAFCGGDLIRACHLVPVWIQRLDKNLQERDFLSGRDLLRGLCWKKNQEVTRTNIIQLGWMQPPYHFISFFTSQSLLRFLSVVKLAALRYHYVTRQRHKCCKVTSRWHNMLLISGRCTGRQVEIYHIHRRSKWHDFIWSTCTVQDTADIPDI